MKKTVSDIFFQSLHGIGEFDKHNRFKDANFTVLGSYHFLAHGGGGGGLVETGGIK